jgi:putative hydrolase of the HAD superfamily
LRDDATRITHLFLDIGGVLLTNGWDRALRRRAAARFGIDPAEMDERHHLTYDTYELGKLDAEAYFERVLFFAPRSFDLQEVMTWIKGEARAFPEVIELVRRLKAAYGLRIAVVSNEARELAVDRIERFRLGELVDFFVVSSFVHLRKPDEDIYRLALDIAQVAPERVAYVDDRPLFVEVAGSLGLRAICHTDAAATRAALARLGLRLPDDPGDLGPAGGGSTEMNVGHRDAD